MKRLLMPMLAAIIIVAMVVPGCGETPLATTYALTLDVSPTGGGTATDLTGTGPYAEGTAVNIQAVPSEGWEFLTWTAPFGAFGSATSATTTFTMPTVPITVTANFRIPVPETGAMIGCIILSEEKSTAASVAKMIIGDVGLHAQPGVNRAEIFDAIVAAGLPYRWSYGSYRDLRYNPVGPIFSGTGKFNPFHYPTVREAMNYLIDRDEIVGEILKGLGEPITAMGAKSFPESQQRYPHLVDAIETKYAYVPGKGETELAAALNAIPDVEKNVVTGKWEYLGTPIEVRLLSRSDLAPWSLGGGDYVAGRLADAGFTVITQYATSGEAAPLWLLGDPNAGLWNVYTGGWGIPGIPRDQGSSPAGMQTQYWYPVPLFAAYEAQMDVWDPTYRTTIDKLRDRDFADLAEREALFTTALWGQAEFAAQTLVCDMASVTPYNYDLDLIINLSYGTGEGWTRALHFKDALGEPRWADELFVEMESLMVNPWNPVDGSNWTYDLTIARDAVTESGLLQHPLTGLGHALQIASAEVTIGDGRPVGFSEGQPAWMTSFNVLPVGTKITVPDGAWADWDAATNQWITVAERFPVPADRTALRKSVVTYPAGMLDGAVPMHDGSTLSLADFVTSFLVGSFAQAKPASPIYDPARVSAHTGFMATFRGWEILSVEPLTIAFYSNFWQLDPEANVATMFPAWKQGGSNPWHMIALGWAADAAGELAFGSAKATTGGVQWMDFTKGPSLPILKAKLDIFNANPTQVPYFTYFTDLYTAWGLGSYQDEVVERMANLDAWYDEREHFWVDMGLYYVADVFGVDKTVVLCRFEDHPDPSDRWLAWAGLEP